MRYLKFFVYLSIIFVTVSCSTNRFIPENKYLLQKVEIKCSKKDVDVASLEPYIRQKANSKWFSLFKIPLRTYMLSGRDTTKWINKTLRKLGEKPVIFDTIQAKLSQQALTSALFNAGYMHAYVAFNTKISGNKLKAIYTLYPGKPFYISSVRYDIQDKNIKQLLAFDKPENAALAIHSGERFTVSLLDNERSRITKLLLDNGYYKFHKDFIMFEADSSQHDEGISLVVKLRKYRVNNESPEMLHPRYIVHSVHYSSADNHQINLRPSTLIYNTYIFKDKPFSAANLQRTYRSFARLQAIKYTNIRFKEIPDTTLLNCDIQLSEQKPRTIKLQNEQYLHI